MSQRLYIIILYAGTRVDLFCLVANGERLGYSRLSSLDLSFGDLNTPNGHVYWIFHMHGFLMTVTANIHKFLDGNVPGVQ